MRVLVLLAVIVAVFAVFGHVLAVELPTNCVGVMNCGTLSPRLQKPAVPANLNGKLVSPQMLVSPVVEAEPYISKEKIQAIREKIPSEEKIKQVGDSFQTELQSYRDTVHKVVKEMDDLKKIKFHIPDNSGRIHNLRVRIQRLEDAVMARVPHWKPQNREDNSVKRMDIKDILEGLYSTKYGSLKKMATAISDLESVFHATHELSHNKPGQADLRYARQSEDKVLFGERQDGSDGRLYGIKKRTIM